MNQIKTGTFGGFSQNQPATYINYRNPHDGNNRIYTREEIGKMSTDEYSANEHAINAQLGSIGIPTDGDMASSVRSGGAVYVSGYTRQDGTEVRGYYRSR